MLRPRKVPIGMTFAIQTNLFAKCSQNRFNLNLSRMSKNSLLGTKMSHHNEAKYTSINLAMTNFWPEQFRFLILAKGACALIY